MFSRVSFCHILATHQGLFFHLLIYGHLAVVVAVAVAAAAPAVVVAAAPVAAAAPAVVVAAVHPFCSGV